MYENRKQIISITMKLDLAQKAMTEAARRGQSRSAFICELVSRELRAGRGQQSGGDRADVSQQAEGKRGRQ